MFRYKTPGLPDRLPGRGGGEGPRRQRSGTRRHIGVGVDCDGVKHVLRIWVEAFEGAKFWFGCAHRVGQPGKRVLYICQDVLYRT